MPNVTSLNVNGKKLRVNADSQTPLLYVLRDELNMTGTKYGCGESKCGDLGVSELQLRWLRYSG
jgi:aerobic-type carbon monoxide dehydrogenase small subunit (CoxS/CutS family)